MSDTLIFIIEMIGTIAFAVSGGMVALENQLDLFGVIALGVITATFGGIFRDLVLGMTPPSAFVNPLYVMTAIAASVILFVIAEILIKKQVHRDMAGWIAALFWMDSFGLGIFTVMGVERAYRLFGCENYFLLIFCGLITGVGGGLLRDMVVHRSPVIFTKHIYAVASIIGAAVMVFFLQYEQILNGIWIGCAVVIILRYLARRYRWNLPKISGYTH